MQPTMVNHPILGIAVASVLVYAGAAQGGGFQITELSARTQGNRNAGAAAAAESASTVFFNPAALTYLEGRRLEAGFHVIIPNFDFSNENSTNAIGGRPIGGENEGGGNSALVPNFYFTQQINDRITLGIATIAPYGLATEYDKDWIGRYNAVESELKTININPSLGFKVNEQFSLGVGFSAQYTEATLSNALDFGTPVFLAGAPNVTPSTPQFDGFQKLIADDWGFGFNLGALYEPRPGTRFGINYRSEIDHTVEGDANITIPDSITLLTGRSSTKRGIEADNTTPATVWLGAYHEIDERWAVLAGATWTDWSVFEELRIEFDDGGADSVQPENWEDSWRYSIGVNYKYSPQFILRAGFEYDESPVRKEDRTPRIPDQDRYWLAIGATYEYSDEFSFDVAYSHIFMSDYAIHDTDLTTAGLAGGTPVGNTLDGEYSGNANIFSAQLQWNF